MLVSLLGMFVSLVVVEKPQFGTGVGSRLCLPRGAWEWEGGWAGRGHAEGMQPPLSSLTRSPRLLFMPETRQGAVFVGRRMEMPPHHSC